MVYYGGQERILLPMMMMQDGGEWWREEEKKMNEWMRHGSAHSWRIVPVSAVGRESRTRNLVGIHREQSKACHSTKQNQYKAEAVSSLTRSMYGHQPVDGGATQSIGDVTPCLPLQPLDCCLLLHSWKAPLSSDVLFRLHGAYHLKAGVVTRRRTIQVWNE